MTLGNTHDITDSHTGVLDPSQLPPGIGQGMVNMLDIEDAKFFSSLGDWVNSGGTMTRDTGVKLTNFNGSLKFVTSGSNQYVEVPVDGTFGADKTYWAILILRRDVAVAGSTIKFGEIGVDEANVYSLPDSVGKPDIFGAFAIPWTVDGSDHTGVTLRLTIGLTGETAYVGWAAVFEADVVPLLANAGQVFMPMTENASNLTYFGPYAGSGLYFNQVADGVFLEAWDGLGGFDANNDGDTFIFAEHPDTGDLVEEGVHVQVGPDLIGLYVSERDSSTIQIYPDDSGGYNVELKNRSTEQWKIVKADDTIKKNLLDMETRITTGSATITSGNTSIAVTHGAGYTPAAADIRLLPTNSPTNDPGNFWVSSIGATQFTINVRANPGASGAIFTWTIDR